MQNNVLDLIDSLCADLVADKQWSYSIKLEKIKAEVSTILAQQPAFPDEPELSDES